MEDILFLFRIRVIAIFIVMMITSQFTHAQIGINTDYVANNLILQIDSKRNNPSDGTTPSASQALDDVAVTNTGNVGIGTLTPQTKLHIVTGGTTLSPNPQFRLEDGLQLTNRVLTCNAQGIGYWEDYVPGASQGVWDTSGVSISGSETSFVNTKAKISLDSGSWAIFYALIVEIDTPGMASNGNRILVKTSLADDTTLYNSGINGFPTTDISGGGTYYEYIVWQYGKSVLVGRYVINNTTTGSKDYYLIAGSVSNPGAVTGITLVNVGKEVEGSSFFAFRAKE
ncbi:hypothetical protein [Dysgonomonas macrotermitis]|uniref:Uncharacterized protein n=1 Tax=Dysgonomonas macrotermitis TaxID=1346286 RepID=A0A1M5EDU4_9BACT|nr:hypothetical protein [Dysgonomonas macrotermitis]SHF77398.1 hypothetical protein SAMN05444362_1106 [Dysgonomonas macrotermitis]